SKTLEAQKLSELKDYWTNIAVERYAEEQSSGKTVKKGLRKICQEVEADCYGTTKKHVRIASSTVSARFNGRQSIREFNAGKRWLEEGEEDAVVNFAIDTAKRGFPLNHKRLKEHVDAI
ncbi:hypothetical protein C8Q76DRAFT_591338, partial [Earliella scabrosa]